MLEASLTEALREKVAELQQLSAGASRETWAITTARGDKRILQRLPRGAERAGVLTEAAILRAVAAAGVPVAKVLEVFEAGGTLDRPALLLEAVPGESLPTRLMRDARYVRARQGLVRQLGEILARLHSIPTDTLPELPRPDAIGRCLEVLDSLVPAFPACEFVLRRLQLSRPPPRPEALVHGDFRLGNLLIDESGVTAVLDWELVHLGDPLEDLGFLCVPAWRFGGGAPVAGVGEYQTLLGAYAAAGGAEVSLSELLWWQVAGTAWWGVMCHVQAQRHLCGDTRSVELAAIGRRACEQEWDALACMEEF